MSFSKLKNLSLMAAGAAVLCLGATVAPAQAATITSLSDNFNGENGGSAALNYFGFANWDVNDGTVDLIGNGSFDYYPGNGLYIDLDGSSGNAGIMSTKSDFASGEYTLSFKLGGSFVGGSTVETVRVLFGSLDETFTVQTTDPLTTFVRNVVLNAPGKLSFANAGGDNIGAILDDVNVSAAAIPTPALLPGLVGMGVAAMRKRRQTEGAEA